jgi:DNA-binding MarR family transcriptional regulator
MAIQMRTDEVTTAWRTTLIAYRSVTDNLDRDLRAEVGLTLGWYEVLLLLASAENERLRMADLAAGMIISRSAATRLVDRLVADGLVCREVCEADRRGTEVALTDEGRKTFLKAGRIHFRGIHERFGAHLSAAELDVIQEALSRVAAANPRV